MAERDYSHVPLWKKLGVRDGSRVRLERVPDSVHALDDLPDYAVRSGGDADVVVLFATTLDTVEGNLPRLLSDLSERGGLWVAWPKKTSKVPHSLDFDTVQGSGLSLGLVDNKTCRVDDDWQAIRFVRRLVPRAAKR